MQELEPLQQTAVYVVLGISLLGIVYAFILRSQIMAQDKGTPKMQEIWGVIHAAASAYVGRQLRMGAIAVAIVALVLGASAYLMPPSNVAVAQFGSPEAAKLWLAGGRALACVVGAILAFVISMVGMGVAVESNVRVTAAARKGYKPALQIAYNAASVSGMLTVGLGLLGATLIFWLAGAVSPDLLLGFGVGGALIALLMRVGGGIYAKAADVAADLMRTVEPDMPQNDPRNAAVVADLVGDTVADCAGTSADTFESAELALVAALFLGFVLGDAMRGSIGDQQYDWRFVIFPLLLRAVGLLASIIGNSFVRTDEKRRNAMAAMNRGFYLAAGVAVAGAAGATAFFMRDPQTSVIDWRPLIATLAGVVLVLILGKLTEYFTSTHFKPVKETSKHSQTGPATNILSGLALGMESSAWSILVIAGAAFTPVLLYAGEPAETQVVAILYGIALTGIGMVLLTGNTVSMGSFGPIADNAYRIGEMAGLDKNARNVMEDLDAVGNTTRVVAKGIAAAAALFAVLALYGAFLTYINIPLAQANLPTIPALDIALPEILIGLFIGAAIPFLFASFTLRAVLRAAFQMLSSVRRQFQNAGIEENPDATRTVLVATSSAQKELLSLGLIALLVPLLLGGLLGLAPLGAFLAGMMITTQLMAAFQSNAGGAWDNAKKYIEEGNYGGKHSDAHQSALIGYTVSTPLKDATGPALNPLLKLSTLVALLSAPLLVMSDRGNPVLLGVMLVCGIALIWAIWQTKREMATESIKARISAN